MINKIVKMNKIRFLFVPHSCKKKGTKKRRRYDDYINIFIIIIWYNQTLFVMIMIISIHTINWMMNFSSRWNTQRKFFTWIIICKNCHWNFQIWNNNVLFFSLSIKLQMIDMLIVIGFIDDDFFSLMIYRRNLFLYRWW